MSKFRMITTSGAALAFAAAAALALPAAAAAEPFESQPTPLGCAAGLGTVLGATSISIHSKEAGCR
ncbi:MAG: hypothetical protein WAW17_14240 [Rhodococcus sp. (in: high G+C Gram-positive bacteria)]|uniref:hypothetical protein n=1 Tax=Rhodococcus sp. TaxID=1831 RepID=UPI003BAFF406